MYQNTFEELLFTPQGEARATNTPALVTEEARDQVYATVKRVSALLSMSLDEHVDTPSEDFVAALSHDMTELMNLGEALTKLADQNQ